MKQRQAILGRVFLGAALAGGLLFIGLLFPVEAFASKHDVYNEPAAPLQWQPLPNDNGPGSGPGSKPAQASALNTQMAVFSWNAYLDAFKKYTATLLSQLNAENQGKVPRDVFNRSFQRWQMLIQQSLARADRNRGGRAGDQARATGVTGTAGQRAGAHRQRIAQRAARQTVLALGHCPEHCENTVKQFCNMCKTNNGNGNVLGLKGACGMCGQAENMPRLYHYARFCADDAACTALGICDMCDGGLRRSEREKVLRHKDDTPDGFIPMAFIDSAPAGFIPAGYIKASTGDLIKVQAGGGGGGCKEDVAGAALNPELLKSASNIPIDPSDCRYRATVTAGLARAAWPKDDFSESYFLSKDSGDKSERAFIETGFIPVVGDSDVQRGALQMQAFIAIQHAAMELGIQMAAVDQALSVNGNCPQNQFLENARQQGGYEASTGQCLSCTEMRDFMRVLDTQTNKDAMVEQGGSPADTQRESAVRTARAAFDKTCGGSSGGDGGGRGGGGGQHIALLEDKTFLALLHDRGFHQLVAMMVPTMPKVYAEEKALVDQIVREDMGLPPLSSYAQNPGKPEKNPASEDNAIAPKPFEKSASLSAIFASNGVKISGWTSMPVVMEVKRQLPFALPAEAAMQAILISDGPAR